MCCGEDGGYGYWRSWTIIRGNVWAWRWIREWEGFTLPVSWIGSSRIEASQWALQSITARNLLDERWMLGRIATKCGSTSYDPASRWRTATSKASTADCEMNASTATNSRR